MSSNKSSNCIISKININQDVFHESCISKCKYQQLSNIIWKSQKGRLRADIYFDLDGQNYIGGAKSKPWFGITGKGGGDGKQFLAK